MHPSDHPRALAAAVATATAAGLRVDDATIVHASNRIAARLMPCDVLARVATEAQPLGAAFEVELAGRLGDAGAPVGTLASGVEPRAYARAGFLVTLWTYYESLASDLAPAAYAEALRTYHAGLRRIEVGAPHFTDRVAEARTSLDDRARTPEVGGADRALLMDTLDRMTASITRRGAPEQLLHGEPHPGNVLNTPLGPRFIDLETCCRGPVEFDLAHAPDEVSAHYPAAAEDLLDECRMLMLAMIITWRWDRDDRLPNGRALAAEWTADLRASLGRHGLDQER
jgi:hypothetical protein